MLNQLSVHGTMCAQREARREFTRKYCSGVSSPLIHSVHRGNAFPALKPGFIVSPDSKSKTMDSNVVKDGSTKVDPPRAKAKIILK